MAKPIPAKPSFTSKTIPTVEQTLDLFEKNLNKQREWYRSAQGAGPEVGLYVTHELILASIATSLRFAREGKEWTAPTRIP